MNRTLLVVDDNPAVLQAIAMLLQLRGFTVHAAASGEEALNLAEAADLDAALVDFVMPGMDGFHTCQALKEQAAKRGRALPVWIMTGALSADIMARARQFDVQEVLSKPLNYDELTRKLGGAIATEVAPPAIHTPAAPPFPDYQAALRHAIRSLVLIGFDYRPAEGAIGWRKVEPHALGRDERGADVLLAYQVAGVGLTPLTSAWKLYRLDALHDLHLSVQAFARARPDYVQARMQLAQIICGL